MANYETEKTDNPDERCEHPGCINKKLNGATMCGFHGGNKQIQSQENRNIRTYRLAKFQAQLDKFANQPNIKSLRDEIGILRIMMEERLNSLNSPLEIMAHTHTISDLCMKIEKLVTSCHKLEKSMGNYLDKSAVIQLGMEIVQIITKYVKDASAIDAIAKELAAAIDRVAKLVEEKDESNS